MGRPCRLLCTECCLAHDGGGGVYYGVIGSAALPKGQGRISNWSWRDLLLLLLMAVNQRTSPRHRDSASDRWMYNWMYNWLMHHRSR